MRDIKSFIANLSQRAGVYQMLGDGGVVLYVGKAKNLKKRVASYFSKRSTDLKTLALVKQIKDITITITRSESEAVILECNLIKQHRPRYNVLLRDDKSYPYILITTQHPFPRIDIYRGVRKKEGMTFGPFPSAYAVRETISLLQRLFRLRTCTNSFFAARTRPCLLYQIHRCTGPCVQLVTQEDYARQVALAVLFLQGKSSEVIHLLQQRMEVASQQLQFELAGQYRDQIARLRQIQEQQCVHVASGNADIIGFATQAGVACVQLLSMRHGQLLGSRAYFPRVPLHSTPAEILSAFITQHYLTHGSQPDMMPRVIISDQTLPDAALLATVLSEQAQHKVVLTSKVRTERKKWLEMAMTSAKQSLAAQLHTKANNQARMQALQAVLGLRALPQRIECFDVSHTMGEATVASCVVFTQDGPLKSHYRRFNIEGITPGDDIAAMRQVITRRFKRLQKENSSLPEVVLIDGGPTQLTVATEVLSELAIEGVLVVGVSKGPDRKPGYETLHIPHQGAKHLPADDLALHFIQHIRDEAHRFAITGHRLRRDKKRQQSRLEDIPGIGAKRRRELLRYFGGIQGLAHASLEELKKVPGISHSLAERIFVALHDANVL